MLADLRRLVGGTTGGSAIRRMNGRRNFNTNHGGIMSQSLAFEGWEQNALEGAGYEEVEISKGEVSLCLLLNRRTRTMRIIDFRAGPQASKFDRIREVAAREGIERAYTVVERDESNTWTKMGFEKEGSIPGFYKRSDAYILGIEIEPTQPRESATRIRIKPTEASPAGDRGERTYQAGRRMLKARAPEALPKVNIAEARPQDSEKAFSNAHSSGRALSGLEPFGRDVEKREILCTARGGFSLLVGVETQRCFDNVFLEALTAPRGDKETWLTAAALNKICDQLASEEVVSAFAVSPADSVELTAAWLAAGFRRTGRLPGHLMVRGQRTEAFLWSRRLCEPV